MNIPKLESLPDSPNAIYLYFAGIPSENVPEFKIPAHIPTTINSAITEIWMRVSEKFSPFNVNVTTTLPSNPNARYHLVAIGGSGTWLQGNPNCQMPGWSGLGIYPGLNYVFSDCFMVGGVDHITGLNNDCKCLSEAIAHEVGHALGREHKMVGVEIDNGDCWSRDSPCWVAPIMGNSVNARRGVWALDDLQAIGNILGWRDHKVGQTLLTATPLVKTILPNLSSNPRHMQLMLTGFGIIQSTTNTDCWSFEGGGKCVFDLIPVPLGGMLVGHMLLRTRTGEIVEGSSTIPDGNSNGAHIEIENLPMGRYVLTLFSRGFNFGDIGQYTVVGSVEREYTPSPIPVVTLTRLQERGNSGKVLITSAPNVTHDITYGPIGKVLQSQYGLYFTGDFQTDWMGLGYKWLKGKTHLHNNEWYFIHPSGNLLAWTGKTELGVVLGTLLEDLEPSYYYRPRLLFKEPWDVKEAFGLFMPEGGHHHNDLGGGEDWWLGDIHWHGNQWYYTVKSEASDLHLLYAWSGPLSSTKLSGTFLASLPKHTDKEGFASEVIGNEITYKGKDFHILVTSTSEDKEHTVYNRIHID